LGVLWVLFSFLFILLVKALVFSEVYSEAQFSYVAHLAIGYALFHFINLSLVSSTTVFSENRGWILSTNINYQTYKLATIFGSFVELLMVFIPATLVVALMDGFKTNHIWSLTLVLPFYFTTAYSLCKVFGSICVLAPDVKHAIQASTRILFFATPIIWIPQKGTWTEIIALFNPITHYIDIVRAPLVYGSFPLTSWFIVFFTTLVVTVIGWHIDKKYSKLVALNV
jgi:ABC-type polysaccharide/polyol phosphate export permease